MSISSFQLPPSLNASKATVDPQISMYFDVVVDDIHDLGSFSGIEGLGAEIKVEPYTEGGELHTKYQLPGPREFTNIKLTRAFDAHSNKLAAWFSSFDPTKRTTAKITAYSPNRKQVGQWSIEGVLPVRWTGPQFKADGSQVATESLELAHTGFTFA
jgi:phage tail-like protein